LGRSKIGPEIELPLFNGSRAADVFDPLKAVILKLLQEITDPAVPFLPTNDKKKMCPGCEFQTFCGTQWILKWMDYPYYPFKPEEPDPSS